MNTTRIASIDVALHWRSPHAVHTDRRHFERISFWRDYFPGDFGERLAQAAVGEPVRFEAAAGDLVEPYDRGLVRALSAAQFVPPRADLRGMVARQGRFYPRDFLFGVSDFFVSDRRPFRCLANDGEKLQVDFNHPLAAVPLTIEARVAEWLGTEAERGGRSTDIPQEITNNGPGMQAPLADHDTDFYAGQPFSRLDPRPDEQFYREPRFVQHLDSAAIREIGAIYARELRPGMAVLDLMSSWVSHLPEDAADLRVTGLGLNRDEMERNPRLADRIVHDLNTEPRLPFADGTFDAAVCTVSVEYLIRPVEVFAEVARVLKPGAPFTVTFSDRWFPTKVIDLWTELHAFERLGLVLDYFRKAGGFTDLATETLRGLPRPEDDKYSDQLAQSDPVFAIRGRRKMIGQD
jgi:SAM-dependent methyltransferase